MTRRSTETPPPRFLRFVFGPPTFWGSVGALILWWASLTPTLLPRSWLFQALVSGVNTAIGYLIGTGIGAVVRWVLRRSGRDRPGESFRRWAWIGVAVVASVAFVVGGVLWQVWQTEQRDLVAMPHLSPLAAVLAVVVSLVVFVVLVIVGRVLGWAVWRLDAFFGRFTSVWVARAITAGLVMVVVAGLATDAGRFFVDWSNDRFGAADTGTAEGVEQPTAVTVSGSPESEASWETLGLQGRSFVAGAATEDELRVFAGAEAEVKPPIRLYAGLDSADTPEARANLVVRELERTGAFDREVLVVATTTGTGWIDPDAARTIEFMHAGDTAIAGMQYSFLPSWISFLVDADKAAAAGRALNDAVHDSWSQLPVADRPRLIVFGESLGSLGSEQAFVADDLDGSLAALTARSDGVLWTGPTYSNPIWEQLIRHREPSSPVWRAEYDGGATVRVGNQPPDLDSAAAMWGPVRVAYFHHPSDPVGYWNWGILWQPPEWTADPIGYDVSPRTGWFPIVTFWQVVADLIAGFDAPPGFGHNYAVDFISGWAAVAAPDGWTDQESARLETFLHPGT